MAKLISDTVNFRAMITTREGYYIVIKGSIHQKDSNTKCVCPKSQNYKIYKQKPIALKEEREKPIIIAGAFNIPLSTVYRITRQKFSKNMKEFNIIINQ